MADITQQRTDEGWLYLGVVLDAFSRRIVGWSMATHLRTELVLDASIEIFYNCQRRHSTLDYHTPASYEQQHLPPAPAA